MAPTSRCVSRLMARSPRRSGPFASITASNFIPLGQNSTTALPLRRMAIRGIGIAIIRDVRQQLRHNKVGLFGPIHLYHLAAAHARRGEYEIGVALMDETS